MSLQKSFYLDPLSSPTRKIVATLFLAAVLARILFAVVTPRYMDKAEGVLHPFNDEYPHLKYSLFLVQHQRLPVNTQVRSLEDPVAWIFYEFEYAQPPLFYVLNIPFVLCPDPILASRFFAVFLSSLTLLLSISLTVRIFKQKDQAALCTVVFLGFNPILLRIGSSVSNDNLAWFLSLLLFRMYLNDRIWRLTWRTGLLIGLGMLTKFSFLIWILFLITDAFLIRSGSRFLPQRMKSLSVILFPALLICGWWYVRNQWVYGEWTGIVGGSGPPGSFLIDGTLHNIQRFVASVVRFTFFPVVEEGMNFMNLIQAVILFFIVSFFLQYRTLQESLESGSVFRKLNLFNALNLLLFVLANFRYDFSETRHLFLGLLPLNSVLVACLMRNFRGSAVLLGAAINSIYLVFLW